jgi:hypothetical protein
VPSAAPNVLRRIAEHELEECFHDLSPTKKAELATSLVRQWTTNGGEAVLLTLEKEFWFHIEHFEDGRRNVVRDVRDCNFTAHLQRNRVIEVEIPALLDTLNVCQSARCYTDDGEMLQLRVNPAGKSYHIELVPDAER